jgi:hypothetical protein
MQDEANKRMRNHENDRKQRGREAKAGCEPQRHSGVIEDAVQSKGQELGERGLALSRMRA